MSSKLREALEEIKGLAKTIYSTSSKGSAIEELADKIVSKTFVALSEPLRNCDVGSADEQHKRFMHFCTHVNKSVCMNCPLIGNTSLCQLQWAQMPYKEGGVE